MPQLRARGAVSEAAPRAGKVPDWDTRRGKLKQSKCFRPRLGRHKSAWWVTCVPRFALRV